MILPTFRTNRWQNTVISGIGRTGHCKTAIFRTTHAQIIGKTCWFSCLSHKSAGKQHGFSFFWYKSLGNHRDLKNEHNSFRTRNGFSYLQHQPLGAPREATSQSSRFVVESRSNTREELWCKKRINQNDRFHVTFVQDTSMRSWSSSFPQWLLMDGPCPLQHPHFAQIIWKTLWFLRFFAQIVGKKCDFNDLSHESLWKHNDFNDFSYWYITRKTRWF